MTKKDALNRLFEEAKKRGFKAGYGWQSNPYISIDSDTKFADFQIFERFDEENSDWENHIEAGYFEVKASICRMGGDTTPEELLEAAEQIRLTAEFAKECESMNLSFTEILGKEA